jgi:hypothetical protein
MTTIAARRPATIRRAVLAAAALLAAALTTAVSSNAAGAPHRPHQCICPADHPAAFRTKASWPKSARVYVAMSKVLKDPPPPSTLWVVNPRRGTRRLLIQSSDFIGGLHTSSSGRQIAFITIPQSAQGGDVWVMGTSKDAAPVRVYQSGVGAGPAFDVWLRKGRVYFEATKTPTSKRVFIFSVHTDGTGLQRHGLTWFGGALSANAKQVVHASSRRFGPPSILTLNSGHERKLRVGPVDSLDWSHDGRWIAYAQAGHDDAGIGVVHPNGNHKTIVAPGDASGFPNPSFLNPTWSFDDRHLVSLSDSAQHAPFLYAVDPFGARRRPRRVPGVPRLGLTREVDSAVWARAN